MNPAVQRIWPIEELEQSVLVVKRRLTEGNRRVLIGGGEGGVRGGGISGDVVGDGSPCPAAHQQRRTRNNSRRPLRTGFEQLEQAELLRELKAAAAVGANHPRIHAGRGGKPTSTGPGRPEKGEICAVGAKSRGPIEAGSPGPISDVRIDRSGVDDVCVRFSDAEYQGTGP